MIDKDRLNLTKNELTRIEEVSNEIFGQYADPHRKFVDFMVEVCNTTHKKHVLSYKKEIKQLKEELKKSSLRL